MFMRHSIFEGSAAAVVTPMNGYGNLDFDAFGRLLEWCSDTIYQKTMWNNTNLQVRSE